MEVKNSKIVIIGAGLVGSATAFSILTQGICDEVVIIDIQEQKAKAEALDLQNCMEYLNRNAKVRAGSYKDCSDADIVVMTASSPHVKSQSRLDMLDSSIKIVKSVVQSVMESGFSGIFLNVTNPVDIISCAIYRLSGLPKNQVIGTGTALDSARLKNIIGDLLSVDPRSVHAIAMGEHGDSQMVPWSSIYIGGKSLTNIIRDNQDRIKYHDLAQIQDQTRKLGWVIAESKGTTNYGIATTSAGIIKAVLYNENKIIPVSTLLEGEYGQSGIFAGVPAVLNRSGVKEIVEMELTQEERENLNRSFSVIQEFTDKIKKI